MSNGASRRVRSHASGGKVKRSSWAGKKNCGSNGRLLYGVYRVQHSANDGPYISARVLASISNPWRFDSSNQLIKIAGYDLGAQRSGKRSDDAVPVISKRGNSELRYALYQAAHVASTRNSDFIRYFTRMLRGRERERGIKTKMKVKLAVKMLKIAWTLMKKQEVFDSDHLMID
jgi:hypothetical protein